MGGWGGVAWSRQAGGQQGRGGQAGLGRGGGGVCAILGVQQPSTVGRMLLSPAPSESPKAAGVEGALLSEPSVAVQILTCSLFSSFWQVWFQNRRSKERRMKQLSALGARRHAFFRSPRRMRPLVDRLEPGELIPNGPFSFYGGGCVAGGGGGEEDRESQAEAKVDRGGGCSSPQDLFLSAPFRPFPSSAVSVL